MQNMLNEADTGTVEWKAIGNCESDLPGIAVIRCALGAFENDAEAIKF
jgi:hypothetical protein